MACHNWGCSRQNVREIYLLEFKTYDDTRKTAFARSKEIIPFLCKYSNFKVVLSFIVHNNSQIILSFKGYTSSKG